MHVVQLISSSGFYGAEGVVVLLSNRLEKLGCSVTLGVFNADQPRTADLIAAANRSNVKIWNLCCSGRLDLLTVRRLQQFLYESRADVLHTHGYKANAYGLAAARLSGCPVIATCHNWTDRNATLRGYGSFDKWLLPKFDRVIAVSEGVADTLRQSGLPDSKLQLVANGIDTLKFRSTTAPIASTPILGVVSRLSIEKGVDVLVRALPIILNAVPNLQCVVVGDGPERENLIKLAGQLGVQDALKLPGFNSDIPSFLLSCSVVVHPSRIDGMPLSILEAMAAAKPIVASAVGEIPTLLLGGEAGVLVPPDNPSKLAASILSLLNDGNLSRQLGRSAGAQAQHHDASVMASRYLSIYKEHLGGNSVGALETHPAPAAVRQ
jgi:glycosyltransferase involved in cell wall biosynthesis